MLKYDRCFRFFAGVVPRVLWITLGGFIYFGIYEKTKNICEFHHITVSNHDLEDEKVKRLIKEERESLLESATAPTYTDVVSQGTKEQGGKLRAKIKKKLEDLFSPRELEESNEVSDADAGSELSQQDLEINIDADFEE